jgi:hypothetical protein
MVFHSFVKIYVQKLRNNLNCTIPPRSKPSFPNQVFPPTSSHAQLPDDILMTANVLQHWATLADHAEQKEVHRIKPNIQNFIWRTTGRDVIVVGIADGRNRSIFSRICDDDTHYLDVLVQDPAIRDHNLLLLQDVQRNRTVMLTSIAVIGNKEEANHVTKLASTLQDLQNDGAVSGQTFKAKMVQLETYMTTSTAGRTALLPVVDAVRNLRQAEWEYQHREASVFSLLCSCSGRMLWQPDTGDFYLHERLIWNGKPATATTTSCVEIRENNGWQPIFPTLNRQVADFSPCVSELFEVVDWRFSLRIRGVVFELALIQKKYHLLNCWVALLLPFIRRNVWGQCGRRRDNVPEVSNVPKRARLG